MLCSMSVFPGATSTRICASSFSPELLIPAPVKESYEQHQWQSLCYECHHADED